MIQYFETTALILLWVLAMTVAWGALVFQRSWRRRPAAAEGLRQGLAGAALIPALALGPVLLVVGFRVLGVNLLYPVRMLTDLTAMVGAAAVPALVLVVASGLAVAVARGVRRECDRWRGKPFVLMARAVGGSESRALRRLVLVKSLCTAWAQCLPWVFSELLVIEVVFNAPGLGLEAWHMARSQESAGLFAAMGWILGLYGLCALTTSLVHNRLGRRLESYG